MEVICSLKNKKRMGVDKMFGISVFPGMGVGAEENLNYMKRAADRGIRYLFTSLHIPESDLERIEFEFIGILERAKSLNMTVIVDISKEYFKRYDWNKYGGFIFRLDFGFTDEEIVEISKEYQIQLNASTVDEKKMERLIDLGLSIENISACHNYYPRKDTGISIEFLRRKNKCFSRFGMRVMAFVGSQNKKRGPLYEGLPTVEGHRNLNILVGTQELLSEGCDVVIVGDSMASGKEMDALGKIKKERWLLPARGYPMSLEEKKIFDGVHQERVDQGEYVVRSMRSQNSMEEVGPGEIAQGISSERKMCSITIDNCNYGRYQGELQIVKRDLPADERTNVVGSVEDRGRLLHRIKPGDEFEFYKINK